MEVYCNILLLQWKQSPILSIDHDVNSLYMVFSLNGSEQKQVATLQLQYHDNTASNSNNNTSNIIGAIIPERFKLLSLNSNDTINADLYTTDNDTLLGSGIVSIHDSNDNDDEWKIKWLKVVSSSLLGSKDKTICNIQICIQLEDHDNNDNESANITNNSKLTRIAGYKNASFLSVLYFLVLILVSFQYMGYLPTMSMVSSRHGLKVGKIHMNLGMDLSENHHIASCVGFSPKFCTPMYLYMHDTGSLALYKGLFSPNDKSSSSLKWESAKLRKIFVPFRGEYSATISKDGELIISEGKKEIYASSDLEILKKYITYG